jgi:hypothetical protein
MLVREGTKSEEDTPHPPMRFESITEGTLMKFKITVCALITHGWPAIEGNGIPLPAE